MNREWSALHKTMQVQLSKKATFYSGMESLLLLRNELLKQINDFTSTLDKEDFYAIPFINVDGYHSKTIAYSLFHIFRIEDIVANSLIKRSDQIFYKNEYQVKMNAFISTTGNELVKQQIADFSKNLNITVLYQYINEVSSSTEQLLKTLAYEDLKRKMTQEDAKRLKLLNCVSNDEKAAWLIDYWCNKDIKGLIQMPFSRHWIMHTEACLRIKDKIKNDKKA